VARFAGVAAGALALAGIAVLRLEGPLLADELLRRGWPLILASAALGTAALVLLRRSTPQGREQLLHPGGIQTHRDRQSDHDPCHPSDERADY